MVIILYKQLLLKVTIHCKNDLHIVMQFQLLSNTKKNLSRSIWLVDGTEGDNSIQNLRGPGKEQVNQYSRVLERDAIKCFKKDTLFCWGFILSYWKNKN